MKASDTYAAAARDRTEAVSVVERDATYDDDSI